MAHNIAEVTDDRGTMMGVDVTHIECVKVIYGFAWYVDCYRDDQDDWMRVLSTQDKSLATAAAAAITEKMKERDSNEHQSGK